MHRPEVHELRRLLDTGSVYCTGLVLQELLQGFAKPQAHRQIINHFPALPLLVPDRQDHISAAELRNRCRRNGVQTGTIDALLAQLCIRHELTMLTTDNDFHDMASVVSLAVWPADAR
ncbi:MAG: PIN domain-containing protein [Proteobacteria bacterium]|nr:PIN domain-containing protein [Pseudomonadota bacterium]